MANRENDRERERRRRAGPWDRYEDEEWDAARGYRQGVRPRRRREGEPTPPRRAREAGNWDRYEDEEWDYSRGYRQEVQLPELGRGYDVEEEEYQTREEELREQHTRRGYRQPRRKYERYMREEREQPRDYRRSEPIYRREEAYEYQYTPEEEREGPKVEPKGRFPYDRSRRVGRDYYQYPPSEESMYEQPPRVYRELWEVPGPMSGLGPRGARRSDEAILDDAQRRLTHHGRVDARHMEVEVENGEIILKGTAADRWEKVAAERAVETIPGVYDVHNRLKVRRSAQRTSPGRRFRQIDVSHGMEVVGSDEENVGEIKEIGRFGVIVERPDEGDIFVPYSACRRANGQVKLMVAADEVDEQGWIRPEQGESEGE